MELIRGIYNLTSAHKGCVLTIGNFDGVHLGHLSVLRRLKAQAEYYQLPATVVVFEPQPAEVFLGESAPARLTRWREKYQFLKQHADRLLVIRFNPKFAALTASQFIEELLINKLAIRHLVVGDDFRFGQKRAGDFALLKQASQRFQFSLEDTQTLTQKGHRISSTEIRKALKNGDFKRAEALLGRTYSMQGRVVHGQKKGRSIGFPTANLLLGRRVSPCYGVFAVKVKVAGKGYLGVANLGHRPTVDGHRAQLEVHLFDFDSSIYGQYIEVFFCKKIRDEKKFASFELLKQQIQLDSEQARAFFACSENT